MNSLTPADELNLDDYLAEPPAAIILYIAGPMSAPGLPDDPAAWQTLQDRCRYASAVQGVLLLQGYVSINPYSTCLARENWMGQPELWYAADLEIIKLCDGIVLLPGWERSVGVTLHELPFARQHGLNVYTWNETEQTIEELK